MSTFLRDYIINLAITMAATALSFLLYKVALVLYGASGLETLTLIRRYQSFLLPIAMLGYGVTMPKYIAKAQLDHRTFTNALFLSGAVLGATALAFWHWQNIIALAAIFTLPAIVSSYFFSVSRGVENYIKGATTTGIFLILLPIAAFAAASDIAHYVYIYAALGLLSIPAIYYYYRPEFSKISQALKDPVSATRLRKLSWARVPGDFFNQGILIVPVQMLLLQNESRQSAYLALGIAIAVAFSIPAKPVSTILLTRIARRGNDGAKTRRELLYSCAMAAVLSSVYYIGVDFVNRFYYDNPQFLSTLQALTPFVLFNTLYILQRSYVDALYSGPMLTYINGLGFAVQLVWAYFSFSPELGLALTSCLIFLATTVAILRRNNG